MTIRNEQKQLLLHVMYTGHLLDTSNTETWCKSHGAPSVHCMTDKVILRALCQVIPGGVYRRIEHVHINWKPPQLHTALVAVAWPGIMA